MADSSYANVRFAESHYRGSCHGKPCIGGKRYPVEAMLEYLAGGDSVEALLEEFSDLERDDILACMAFAGKALSLRSQHLVVP